jgi:hypothetical protein
MDPLKTAAHFAMLHQIAKDMLGRIGRLKVVVVGSNLSMDLLCTTKMVFMLAF